MSEEKQEKPITTREKVALWCLMTILKVVKPMNWDSDYKTELTKLQELIDKE